MHVFSRKKFKSIIRQSFVFRSFYPRRTHLYCVGTAKSGTHSIEALMGEELRSAHEPESDETIDFILNRYHGYIDDAEVDRHLLKRDMRLWLELDSSHLNYFFFDRLSELFPKAKFILTIRDPYSWLDSFLNHQLSVNMSDKWKKLRDIRFRPDLYIHHEEEHVLKAKNLYTLDGYLSYWSKHNSTIINSLNSDKLLIVRTDEITQRMEEIYAFSETSPSILDKRISHSFKAKEKFDLLDQIDPNFLNEKVREHCSGLMIQFFPEISMNRL